MNDKEERRNLPLISNANQLYIADSCSSPVSVADVDLPVAEYMDVVLDWRLTFHKHVSKVNNVQTLLLSVSDASPLLPCDE